MSKCTSVAHITHLLSVEGSVTFWCGSGFGSPDQYLRLMDHFPFSYFFLITYPQVHHLQS